MGQNLQDTATKGDLVVLQLQMQKEMQEGFALLLKRIEESERHMLFAMEQMQHDMSDMFTDHASTLKDKTDNHEERIQVIEKATGIAA